MELAGARLLVLNGPDRARALQLNKEDTTIGTSVAADLRLADAAVSRLHAAIVWNKSEFLLLDLDSTNGTRVGKQRIKSVFLDFGDVIAMGSTRLRFETSRRRV